MDSAGFEERMDEGEALLKLEDDVLEPVMTAVKRGSTSESDACQELVLKPERVGTLQIRLCRPKSEDTHKGSIWLFHLLVDCKPRIQDYPNPIMATEEDNALIEAEYGPDDWKVMLRGPEILVLEQLYRGNCTYEFPFEVKAAGEYRVSVELLYEKYEGVHEVLDLWPRLVQEQVLLGNYSMLHVQQAPKVPQQLPDCPRDGSSFSGRWIHIHHPLRKLYKTDLEYFSKNQPELLCEQEYVYHWDCAMWKTDDPEHPLLYHSRCKPPKNSAIVIFGDSHGRHTYEAMVSRFRGEQEFGAKKKFQNASEMVPETENVRLEFFTSGHLEEFTSGRHFEEDELRDFDYLVLNSGQWAASLLNFDGHQLWGEYRRRMNAIAKNFIAYRDKRANSSRPIRMVWQQLNAYPPVTTYPFDFVAQRDWRSRHRLRVWADTAKKVFRNYGIPVSENFAILDPMLCRSYDLAHFRGDEIQVTLDDIFYKLDYCGDAMEESTITYASD